MACKARTTMRTNSSREEQNIISNIGQSHIMSVCNIWNVSNLVNEKSEPKTISRDWILFQSEWGENKHNKPGMEIEPFRIPCSTSRLLHRFAQRDGKKSFECFFFFGVSNAPTAEREMDRLRRSTASKISTELSKMKKMKTPLPPAHGHAMVLQIVGMFFVFFEGFKCRPFPWDSQTGHGNSLSRLPAGCPCFQSKM